MESAFEIIAEPNRRAILSLLVSSEQSVGEIERQLRMSQPTVSKHLRVLRDAGFVESTVDAQRRLYRLKPEPFRRWMTGWRSSAGSGPRTWMLSNATSTGWSKPRQHQRRRNSMRPRRNREREKGGTDENQIDQRLCGRPGEGAALLYRSAGFREESRLQPGAVSLAHRGLIRGAGRHGAAAGAEQQPGGQEPTSRRCSSRASPRLCSTPTTCSPITSA